MDIENLGGYYWHTRIGELYRKKKYTQEEKEELDRKFEHFFYAMETRGFNPALSHISIAHFVPAQILSPISWRGQPIDGISWLSQLEMSSEEVEQLLKRYRMLYNEMRRHIIAVVDKSVFDKNSIMVKKEIDCIGKCIGIKCAQKKSNCMKIPKQYKKFFKTKKVIVLLEKEIEHQVLYYKHGKLKSKLADILTDKLYKSIRTGVYVAGTITESIVLETYLDEIYSMEVYKSA